MTMVKEEKKRCWVCGHEFYSNIMRSYTIRDSKEPDLDTRPRGDFARMHGYNATTCPRCGYVAFGIDVPTVVQLRHVLMLKNNRELQELLGTRPSQTKEFYVKRGLLMQEINDARGAFVAFLEASWQYDDDRAHQKILMNKAIYYLEDYETEVKTEGSDFSDRQLHDGVLSILEKRKKKVDAFKWTYDPNLRYELKLMREEATIHLDIHKLVYIDLLRRTGRFAKASLVGKSAGITDRKYRRILQFQMGKTAAEDPGVYTLEDVFGSEQVSHEFTLSEGDFFKV